MRSGSKKRELHPTGRQIFCILYLIICLQFIDISRGENFLPLNDYYPSKLLFFKV